MRGFPVQRPGMLYLTEGGQETEIMYRHGHSLPEFAIYPLLDQPQAISDLRAMYERYFETAVRHQFVPLAGGLDYRASPGWGRSGEAGPNPPSEKVLDSLTSRLVRFRTRSCTKRFA